MRAWVFPLEVDAIGFVIGQEVDDILCRFLTVRFGGSHGLESGVGLLVIAEGPAAK